MAEDKAQSPNTLTDEILVIAETLGDIKARFERVESEFETQSKPLEAAVAALSAALTGIKTLQNHVLENSLSALSLKVEEQRKAIDDQIGVIVTDLQRADEANAERGDEAALKLREEIAGVRNQLGQLTSQFAAQIERVQLEAAEKMTQLAAVPGRDGKDGAGLNPRGKYDPTAKYSRLDVVELVGSSYISNVDGNTEKPSDKAKGWTLLAKRGGAGPGGGAGNFASLAGVAEISQGGTGQTTAAAGARALLEGVGSTQGDILYRSGSQWTALPAGAADTVLKSQGAGANPQWAATTSATAATDAQAAAQTSTTTFVTPANAAYAAARVTNARSPRQGLLFSGAGWGVVSGISVFGSGDFTVGAWVNPTTLPAAAADIFGGEANAFQLALLPDGTLMARKVTVDNVSAASTGVLVAGKSYFVAYVRSGTTGTYYINGVAAGTTSDNYNYSTAVTKIGSSVEEVYNWKGFLAPVIENRALSASEITALFESGQVSGADINSASNTALNVATFTDAEAPYSTPISSASATGFTAVSNGSGFQCAICPTTFTSKVGAKFLLTYTLTLNSGTAPSTCLVVGTGGAEQTNIVVTSAGTNSVVLTGTTNATVKLNFFNSSSASDYVISNISLKPLGALLAPDAAQPGSGTSWYDTSGNNATISWSSGVQWAVPSSGRYAGNNYTFGSRSGEQATPTKVAIDGTFANSSTPTNQQLKLSLIDVSSTEAYGWSVAANGGVWHHSGNTSGETGYHVLATGGVERVRVTSTGSTFSGTGTHSFAGDVTLSKAGNASVSSVGATSTAIGQFIADSGDGTTSGRTSRMIYRTLETSPQRWDVGMLGTKSFKIQDNTNTRDSLIVSDTTGGVSILGTATNDNAATGYVGEYVSNTGSLTSCSNGTPRNCTSISLTAGDWDVTAILYTNFIGATASFVAAGINTTSATIPSEYTGYPVQFATLSDSGGRWPVAQTRISLSATTTVYLVGQLNFSAGTAETGGTLMARRVR